ncbi:Yip1 domain-containing protein [Desulfocicer vacuolatum DSM 3385]|uniref:Yip1 domain-containing protein n=1 Tax=Desulfocicer vacuolatum DSM 3385 TaxID=1121400 RepID=A0A1W1YTT3_9BACT|nr:YIP1 family protein [Desulfocicer vacuolatum]SMC39617.1 Yip1 domain-containing protein [Desulfocicer vacuolatum DSM 3385]
MFNFSIKNYQFYAYAIVQLLIEPGQFFMELPKKSTKRTTWGFMVLSSLFYAAASLLTGTHGQSVGIMGMVFFMNALGIVLISAVIGHVTLMMLAGKKEVFSGVLSIYAFSSGITFFLSWLPFMLWFTEPWRWWLLYTGFKHSFGLTGKRAFWVVSVSVFIQVCLLYSAIVAFGATG